MNATGPLTPAPPNKPLILVIDDDPLVVRVVEAILVKHGYRVRSASSPHWGLALALRDIPDLILLDFMLPERDGLSVLEDLRAMPDLQTVPVVMLTAHSGKDLVYRARLSGVTDFLVKPFTAKVLVERAEKWIAQAVSQREAKLGAA